MAILVPTATNKPNQGHSCQEEELKTALDGQWEAAIQVALG